MNPDFNMGQGHYIQKNLDAQLGLLSPDVISYSKEIYIHELQKFLLHVCKSLAHLVFVSYDTIQILWHEHHDLVQNLWSWSGIKKKIWDRKN